jgi:hypothetical protein
MRPYFKSNQRKRACSMTQAVELLSCKHKSLSSNPSITKKQKYKKKEGDTVSWFDRI